MGTFLNYSARNLGKPRRILTDADGPGFRNHARTDASDTLGWQLIAALPGTQSPNGLTERAARSIKTAARHITSTESRPKAAHRILTMAVLSKNHAPHTIDGATPAMSILDRCDILAGYAQTAFNRNPDSTGPSFRNMDATGGYRACKERLDSRRC